MFTPIPPPSASAWPTRLVTPRLVLRAAEPSDAPALASYVRANAGHLAAHETAWPREAGTPAYWLPRIAQFQDEISQRRALRFLVTPVENPRIVIGTASLLDVVRGSFQRCFFGAAIAAERQGRGLAREAANCAIRCAFEDLELHRLEGAYVPENERSARFVAALGFQVEGLARGYRRVGEAWRDHVLVGLLKSDWSGEPDR